MPRMKRDVVTDTELPLGWKDDGKYWTASDGKKTLLRDLTPADRHRIKTLLHTNQEQVLDALRRQREADLARMSPEAQELFERLIASFAEAEDARTPEQVDRAKAKAVDDTKMMQRIKRIEAQEAGEPALRRGTIRPRLSRRWDTY